MQICGAPSQAVLLLTSQSLYSFYPTEYLANEAKKVAGEEFVVRPGLKRFGNNDEFVAHKN